MNRRRAYRTIVKIALKEMKARLNTADATASQVEKRQLFREARNCAARVLRANHQLNFYGGCMPIQARIQLLAERMPRDERPYWSVNDGGYYGVLEVQDWVRGANPLACTRIQLLELIGPAMVEPTDGDVPLQLQWLWRTIANIIYDAREIGLIYRDQGHPYCNADRYDEGMYRELYTATKVLMANPPESWPYADSRRHDVWSVLKSLQAFVQVFAHRIGEDYAEWRAVLGRAAVEKRTYRKMSKR